MRYLLIGIFLFLAWSAGSGYWYLCKIKGICPTGSVETPAGGSFQSLPGKISFSGPEGEPIWESHRLLIFEMGKAEPQLPEDFPLFADALAGFLAANPGLKLRLEGKANADEAPDPNALARDRAAAFRRYLALYQPGLDSLKIAAAAQPAGFSADGLSADAVVLNWNPTDSMPLLAEADLPEEIPDEEAPEKQELQVVEAPVKEEPVKEKPVHKAEPQKPKPQPDKDPTEIFKEFSAPLEAPKKRIIQFDGNSPEIKSSGEFNTYVDQLIRWLWDHPGKQVHIYGYTDNSTDLQVNMKTGMRRAEAIRDRFKSRGLDASRMVVMSFGQEYPVATNTTPEGRAQNARVEIQIK